VSEAILEIKNLKKYFPVKGGFLRQVVAHVKAVDGVSFKIEKGKTLGLVGESGCGKSTLGRNVLRLQKPTDGQVLFEGTDILTLNARDMKNLRRNMQIIFQDPYASLNPRMTVHEILREPLDTHKIGSPRDRDQKILDILDIVGLRQQVLNRYPHEFSGGQRQRIGISRALMLGPKFIVADEPVSALDVSVQSQVLNLISDLQERLGISFLFIAHDLAVVQHVSHDVGVMYLGKLVEKASTEQIYKNPKHPYTKALLDAIPVPDPENIPDRTPLVGDVPSPINPPSGCPFHNRCPVATDKCKTVTPIQKNIGSNAEHLVSCHLY
jgi:oligopeptide transport system ATP-binding protein